MREEMGTGRKAERERETRRDGTIEVLPCPSVSHLTDSLLTSVETLLFQHETHGTGTLLL